MYVRPPDHDHVGDPRRSSMTSQAMAGKTGRMGGMPWPCRNHEIDWNAFDPKAYHAHNYLTMRDDDRQIIVQLRDFFGAASLPANALGLDVGPGANLYPALSMLPFCSALDLIDYSTANVAWLRGQQSWTRRSWRSWDPFWRLYGEHPAFAQYVRAHRPAAEFRRKAYVGQGSIFELPKRRYDIGTMFFVACSMSEDRQEFFRAVTRFLAALKPGAPFAAAFMTGSSGYAIEGRTYPAFPVTPANVAHVMRAHAPSTVVTPIVSDLRPDVGMVLATGYRGK
ncbi:SCO2525 family SAM-dependent methyltransferase [Dactylosporangium sp. CS-047395]|uniref:SCO2525 family SAM-dependent methyltransferase n=1 Tax=Dactylosporangium sp. CS-047395 TaxID=3239936 RepID=UPI003D89DE3E